MRLGLGVLTVCLLLPPLHAGSIFFFSTGTTDGLMATASRPDAGGLFEIESADDFALTSSTLISSATFDGLLTGVTPTIGDVVVEIYRIFPLDSTDPPSGNVPTRTNSPSDVAFDSRDAAGGTLDFTTTTLSASFTAGNSVTAGGIHPIPNQTTLGNGPATGEEVEFNVSFTTPFYLPAGHYFFVPQVQVTGGDFLWLSAPRPITGGTPFPPGMTDLQTWTRDAGLDPDWLRVGTDIAGSGAFNAAFSLTGTAVREPATWTLFAAALTLAGTWRRTRRPNQP